MLAMKAVKGAGWLVFSRFVGRLIDFVTLLILARLLTVADFGITALAMSVVAIVDTVLEIPVTQSLMRLRHIDKSHLDTVFTLSAARSAALAVILVLLAWPFSVVYHDGRLIAVLIALAIGPVVKGLISPNMVGFARALSFHQLVIVECVGKFSALVVSIATVFAGGGYWAIVANFVTSGVASTLMSYVLAPYRPSFSLARIADFSNFIGWFSAAQIVSALNWQFDRIALGRFASKETLGQYSIASDLATLPTQSLIGPALQPVMAAFSQMNSDQDRLQRGFLKATQVAMLISVPATVGIALTADLLVALLLGPKWNDAIPFLMWLPLAVLPIPYFQTLSNFSVAINRPIEIFKLNTIDFGLRLALVSMGLYFYAVDGVVGARILISLLMFFVYLSYARRLVGLSISKQLRNLWKSFAAAVLMAVVVLALRTGLIHKELGVVSELIIISGIGAIVYCSTLYLCGLRLNIGRNRLELMDVWW